MRHAAHRYSTMCFWYQSVAVAKARASCRYRMANPASHLPGSAAFAAASLPRRSKREASVICCIRPRPGRAFERELRRLRRSGARLIADFDDLLFQSGVAGAPSWTRDPRLGGAEHHRLLSLFDEFTVATAPLAEALRRMRPDAAVTLVPNGLSESWLEDGAWHRRWRPNDDFVIRYFAGSPSHDDDFAMVAPVLREFLDRYRDVHVEVFGPLNGLERLASPERVRQHARLRPFEHLPPYLASSWVTIAPLRRSAYNYAKSAIKFLEPAGFGCPTIASPNSDLMRHAERGAPVLLCETAQEWYEALCRLRRTSHRMEVGGASHDYVVRHAMSARSGRLWRSILGVSH